MKDLEKVTFLNFLFNNQARINNGRVTAQTRLSGKRNCAQCQCLTHGCLSEVEGVGLERCLHNAKPMVTTSTK